MTTKNKESTLYKVATDAMNPWKIKVSNSMRVTEISEIDLIEKNLTQANK